MGRETGSAAVTPDAEQRRIRLALGIALFNVALLVAQGTQIVLEQWSLASTSPAPCGVVQDIGVPPGDEPPAICHG